MSASAGSVTRLGILGAGNVGSALLRRLEGRSDIEVTGVLVRDLDRPRGQDFAVPFTTDPEQVLSGSDIVVELMGGTGLARQLMLRALEEGRIVVTANKAALAEHWDEFLPWLEQGRVYFEAAVMAGTPVIGPVSSSLRGTSPLEVHAILNGTCSFMLSRLEAGERFEAALAEAQRLGYAEADPSLDIGGIDAAHKLAIIARLAFDPELGWDRVRQAVQGIGHLTPAMVREAMEDGGSVALLCSIQPGADAWLSSVRPVYLPAAHPLGVIGGNANALLYRSAEGGDVLISGPGAGGEATASGVLGDILQALAGRPGPLPLRQAAALPVDFTPDTLGELPRP
jgi:homoserine dehydrogenase